MALVTVEAVGKSYPRHAGLRTVMKPVVEDVSFSLDEGETLGLVGESGSGKSTVARMILGLVKPTTGKIVVDNIDLSRANATDWRQLRRRMQPVFQDPFAALNPRMKVFDIVSEPWKIHGAEGMQVALDGASVSSRGMAGDLRSRVGALLREVGLDESALGRYPHEFSGGQRQRINIARALALRPKILILDEPVSALDVSVGAQVINLLKNLQSEHRLTYLFISHSMPLVRYLSTRIAVMQGGRLVEMGEAVAVCSEPRHAYTRHLLQATPELPSGAA